MYSKIIGSSKSANSLPGKTIDRVVLSMLKESSVFLTNLKNTRAQTRNSMQNRSPLQFLEKISWGKWNLLSTMS